MAREYTNRAGRLPWAAALIAALGLAACDIDEMLEVNDPDVATPGMIEGPDALPFVVRGAIRDFTVAYAGLDNFLLSTAVITDELHSTGTFPTRTATDRRDQFPIGVNANTSDAAYNELHRARRALRDAAARVAELEGQNAEFRELKALEAYTYVALGEGFCSAIPISEARDGEFIYGQPKTTGELFEDAVGLFDEALGSGESHLAAIGKARALLSLGRYEEAAEAVKDVPTEYNYFLYHSDAGLNNQVFALQENGRYAVSDREGGNGLPFRSADDPRTPWFRDPNQPDGFDDNYALYKTLKYRSYGAPVVLASGVEARLIEAEAALNRDDYGTWLGILNDLRANVGDLMAAQVDNYTTHVPDPELPPLTDPGDRDGRVLLMFEERAFWMYLTGHRLGDLRRLVRHYGFDPEEVFPTGAYHKGGTYGRDVALPVDFEEANNPNFQLEVCDVRSVG